MSTEQIGALAEALDAHRKERQAAAPGLTLTGMYNVLEKVRDGITLTKAEQAITVQADVPTLRQIHDELDAAVLDAYGWTDLLPLLRIAHGNAKPAGALMQATAKRHFEEQVLARLVVLNAERAAEEAAGHVRWLRPDFQQPLSSSPVDVSVLHAEQARDHVTPPSIAVMPWPTQVVDQVRLVRAALDRIPRQIEQLGGRFTGRWRARLPRILDALVATGAARHTASGWFKPEDAGMEDVCHD